MLGGRNLAGDVGLRSDGFSRIIRCDNSYLNAINSFMQTNVMMIAIEVLFCVSVPLGSLFMVYFM